MNKDFKKSPDIIIVDDHLIFRQGLKAIINFENIGSVIGEASNGVEFMNLLSILKPDLVLMDIDMPDMDGFEATARALEILPDLRIIAFTVFAEEEYYNKMFNIGAKGFILKSDGFIELENAISLVMQGDIYYSNKLRNISVNELEKTNSVENKEADTTKFKKRLQFFPWVVNKRNCVNS